MFLKKTSRENQRKPEKTRENQRKPEKNIYLREPTYGGYKAKSADHLEKAAETGLVQEPTDRLFATVEADPIAADDLAHEQRRARLTGATISGQGTICEGLDRARKLKRD